jgi:tRNA threonylcarbamoyladenosine biosynthesis protein TsaE
MKYISNCEQDTAKIGTDLAKNLKKGDVVAFYGDLGVGKTAFIKGFVSHFGDALVQSPTFTIVNEYEGTIPLYHFDAYRINADDWMGCGFDEYLFGKGICLIEWAENVEEILPENTVSVTISKNMDKGDDYREIEIRGMKGQEK